MKRLQEKLQSERGASLLLALMMFLVCMLVTATVLAAAMSNAGKARSNQAEQRKFLFLSSALQLICDELEQAEYQGQYDLYKWDVPEVKDADGNVTTPAAYYYHIQQVAGKYSCGVNRDPSDPNSVGELTKQIPLCKELDEIFSKQFTGPGYAALSGTDIESATSRTLTMTVTGLEEDTGPEAYQVVKAVPGGGTTEVKVTVQVKLDHNTRHITLTAWLGDSVDMPTDGQDTMSAELVVQGAAPTVSYSPGSRTPGTPNGTGTLVQTAVTTKWKLNWIKKGAP